MDTPIVDLLIINFIYNLLITDMFKRLTSNFESLKL